MRAGRTLVRAAAAVLGLSASASAAADQAPAPTRADTLFESARHLRASGLYADACPKFAEVEQVEPGVGVMLYLADCYEHTGRSANAWAEFRKAEKLAMDRKDQRADVARARADALEPKISRMTLAVAEPARHLGLEVAVDGTHIPQDRWNMALPTDPGEHSVEVVNPGQPARTIRVRIEEATPLLVPVIEGPSSEVHASAPSEATAPPPSESASTHESHLRTYVSLGLLGAGGLGVAVGAGFLDAKNRAVSENRNSDAGTISAVCFALGGAAFASSVVLYLTAPKEKDTALTVAPAAIATGTGAVLRGRF